MISSLINIFPTLFPNTRTSLWDISDSLVYRDMIVLSHEMSSQSATRKNNTTHLHKNGGQIDDHYYCYCCFFLRGRARGKERKMNAYFSSCLPMKKGRRTAWSACSWAECHFLSKIWLQVAYHCVWKLLKYLSFCWFRPKTVWHTLVPSQWQSERKFLYHSWSDVRVTIAWDTAWNSLKWKLTH